MIILTEKELSSLLDITCQLLDNCVEGVRGSTVAKLQTEAIVTVSKIRKILHASKVND